MLDTLWPWMHLGSRIIFAVSVMVLSMGHFTATDTFAGYAASKKTPAPKAAVLVSGLMVWAGAIFIALGWHRFIGAGLVILFLVPISFKIHNYWSVSDPTQRMLDRDRFWKNLALAGATLFIATYGRFEWPMSLGH
jgi:putative oxidoreductase